MHVHIQAMKSHSPYLTLAFITYLGLPTVISQAPVPQHTCCRVQSHLNGVHVHCKTTSPDTQSSGETCVHSYENLHSLERIQSLNLSLNGLSIIPNIAKPELTRLLALDLSHNALQVLPRDALRFFSKLETLNLSHNQLGELTSESFAQLTSLEMLNLSFNQLLNLPVGAFDDQGQMLTLDVSHNLLSSLPADLLRPLSSLASVSLSHNRLAQLPSGLFHRLPGLRQLDLSHNRLLNVSEGVFQGLESLRRLHLAHNQLKAVSASTFKGLKSLRHLDLSHNQLSTLRKASFTVLGSLCWLSLSSNRLKKLPEHLFAGLRWLEYLDLSDNQLLLDKESLPPEVFRPLQSLRSLHLHHNDHRTEGRYPEQVFSPLAQLRHLSIDTYRTVHFGEDFSQLSQLKTLELPACKAKVLSSHSFQGLQGSSLDTVRLDGCPLQETPDCPFCGFSNLETFSFTNRSGKAECDLGINSLIGPENARLRRVNLANTRFCPQQVQYLADHTLKNLDRLEVLDLSGNGLKGVSFSLKESVKRIVLSGNEFESVPVNLSGLSRLTLLDLSDNAISTLTASERDSLDRQAKGPSFNLKLKGNRFRCPLKDCSDAELYNWFSLTEVTFDGGQVQGRDYPCVTEEGRAASSMEMARAYCQESWNSVYGSLLVGVFSVLVTVLVSCVFCRGRERVPAVQKMPAGGAETLENARDGGADEGRDARQTTHVLGATRQPTLHLSELDCQQVAEGTPSSSDSSLEADGSQEVESFANTDLPTLQPQRFLPEQIPFYAGDVPTAPPLLRMPNTNSWDDRDATLTNLGVSAVVSRRAPSGNRDDADGSSFIGSYPELPGNLGFTAVNALNARGCGTGATSSTPGPPSSSLSTARSPTDPDFQNHHHTVPKQLVVENSEAEIDGDRPTTRNQPTVRDVTNTNEHCQPTSPQPRLKKEANIDRTLQASPQQPFVRDETQSHEHWPTTAENNATRQATLDKSSAGGEGDVPGFLSFSTLSSGASSISRYDLHHQTFTKQPVEADEASNGNSNSVAALPTETPFLGFTAKRRNTGYDRRCEQVRVDEDDDERRPLGFQPVMNLSSSKARSAFTKPVEETGSSK